MSTADQLVARFGPISTCQISDSLRALGMPNHGLQGIYPLELEWKFVGMAFTVRFEPAAEARKDPVDYMRTVSEGDAIVIDNSGRLDCSVWGGQRSIDALDHGAVGTVVHGAYRDLPEHRALAYPVFARAPTVVGSSGLAVPTAVNEPVAIGNVTVHPHDFVMGDASGVIVVPAGSVLDVVKIAEEIAAEEDRITQAFIARRQKFS